MIQLKRTVGASILVSWCTYTTTPKTTTGYTPYYLLFGREARLPVDLCFGLSLDEEAGKTHLQYVRRMKGELQKAYKLAAERSLKSHQRNKWYYDKKVKHQHLEKGDRVLIRNLALTGKHKLHIYGNIYHIL